MSARVLNPVVLTEFYKLRSPSSVTRNLPCNKKINRIKKDLFGKVNPIETRKIFEDEIEKHHNNAVKKWGFDFQGGYPISGHTTYIWERVSFSDFIPEMYTLSRAAHIRETTSDTTTETDILLDERASRQNTSSDELDILVTRGSRDNSVLFKVPIQERLSQVRTSPSSSSSSSSPKRQPKITEYMKERKRLAPTPKKISPTKRMRNSLHTFIQRN